MVDHIRDLSGHSFISFELNIKKSKPSPKWINYRPVKEIDLGAFNTDISSIVWERILSENVNDSILTFNTTVVNLFDRHAPMKKSYVKEQSYPWITHTIKQMMKLRDDAHAKFHRTKLENHKSYYKELKKNGQYGDP